MKGIENEVTADQLALLKWIEGRIQAAELKVATSSKPSPTTQQANHRPSIAPNTIVATPQDAKLKEFFDSVAKGEGGWCTFVVDDSGQLAIGTQGSGFTSFLNSFSNVIIALS